MLDPLDYPYVPIDRPGLLSAGAFETLPNIGRGEPLLAVGSNASAEVLRRKLDGPVPPLPVAPCIVGDLAVGHSAHVSRPGFLAAAPYRRAGARTSAVALWPDPAQLAALDATEPSYERVWLSAERYPLWVGILRPTGCWVHSSRFGLLADSARRTVPLRSQAAAHEILRELPEIAELLGDRGPVDVTRLLATESARSLVDGALRRHGRVAAARV